MTIESDILTSATPIASARCAHCGLNVPAGLIDPAQADQFCCSGCKAVYETLHACGLESYYRLREAAEGTAQPAHRTDGSFESFDAPAFVRLYVDCTPDGFCTADLVLEGVTCAACVWLVERLPQVLEGVIEARLSLREATVRVRWNPAVVSLSRIAQTLDRIGYTPHPARGIDKSQLHQKQTRQRLIHLGIAGAIMGNTMLLALALYAGDRGYMEAHYRTFFRWISAGLGTLSLAWPGAIFFRSAWAAIRMRTTNLDVPIALALLAGGVAGLLNVVLNRGDIYFDSLTVLVFLLLLGRFIQFRQQRRADDAVGLLFSLTPSSCRIVRENVTLEIPIEALAAGNIVEVRPGELFPADGRIESGRSTANQALLTGESMPVAVEVGSPVHAGSQNIESTLRVLVEKVGSDTRVAGLMGLIERGVRDKPPIVQFADTVGGCFVIVVSIVAFVVLVAWSPYGFTRAIDHAVALLIVTCPCVLGLATPMTLAIAIGRLARRDILVKSGAALECLASKGRIYLDKTGTLTEGRLRLLDWTGPAELKPAVAELERRSNHPVGRSLHQALISETPLPTDITDIVERGDGGISGRWNGQVLRVGSARYMRSAGIRIGDDVADRVLVALDDRIVASALLGDAIRPDSSNFITRLQSLGWSPSILSGDSAIVVNDVASQIGLDPRAAHGLLSPEEKLARISDRHAGESIVMVGDGVNDSAALAAADVGIAVHGGAEASLAAADIYIARPGLAPLLDLIHTSRLAMRTIRRNLWISLSYNLLAGALAAAGVMSPLIAAILMPLSSVTVLSLAVASINRSTPKGGAAWK